MSNDATVKFGYDGAELNRGLADAEKRIGNSSRNIERNMARTAGRSSGAMRNLGGASMQVQDIAVQLQSGTKMATVIAQQGSQMLSVFGPAGAIVGGLVAVGGAFYTMGSSASESFKTTLAEAEKFRQGLKLTLADATAGNMASGLGGIDQQLEEVNRSLDVFYTKSGSASAKFAEWFEGDKSANEKVKELTKIKFELEDAYGQVIEQSLKESSWQIELLKLKAEGNTAAVETREREMKLTREIARIEASKMPQLAKEQLIIDARAKSAVLEQQAAQTKMRAADAERLTLERKATERQGNRDTEMRSLRTLDLRSRGREREAEKIERNEKIIKEAERIRQTTGASLEQAAHMAEDRVNLEERIQRRNSGQRSRIRAYPRGDGGMRGNLDKHYLNQLKYETGIADFLNLPGYRQGQRVHSRPIGESGLTGPFQPLNPGDPKTRDFRDPLDRFRRNTSRDSVSATIAGQRGTDLATKIDLTNELLSRGLLG
jgi:hypothetical protein